MEVDLIAILLIGVLVATIRMATPILFASIGENLTELSGVINLGMEGTMAMGAAMAFIISYTTNNLVFGVLSAMAVGGLMGLIMAFMCITLRANQVVVGVTVTIFGGGLATYLYRVAFGFGVMPHLIGFNVVKIPILSEIPIVGPILFGHYALTYLAIILTIAFHFLLSRTHWGLRIKATGENPKASDTAGVNIYVVRYSCVIIGAIIAAIGGSFLTTAYSEIFLPGIVAGRGWMGVAVVMLARWDFLKALGGSMLFGAAEAIQLRLQLQGFGIPPEFFQMSPYLIIILTLVLVARRMRPPENLGVPYERGE